VRAHLALSWGDTNRATAYSKLAWSSWTSESRVGRSFLGPRSSVSGGVCDRYIMSAHCCWTRDEWCGATNDLCRELEETTPSPHRSAADVWTTREWCKIGEWFRITHRTPHWLGDSKSEKQKSQPHLWVGKRIAQSMGQKSLSSFSEPWDLPIENLRERIRVITIPRTCWQSDRSDMSESYYE
jgi:hypothetical protein